MKFRLKQLSSIFKSPSSGGDLVPDRRLVFYHIPKTAGSAVRSALKDLYVDPNRPKQKSMHICNAHSSLEVSQITGRKLKEVREIQLLMALADSKNRLVAGHFSYSCLAYEHYRKDTLFMSLLRDPVARFLSHYFYNRYKKSDHYSLDCSLDEYLDGERAHHSARTYMHNFGVDKCGLIEDPNDQYNQALQNLRDLDILGVVEDMASFANTLSERVGRRVEFPKVRPNPRGDNYSEEVTPVQRRKIEAMCTEDLNLYYEVRDSIV